MSTPAPAAEDQPFDPKAFPKDLIAAQLKLAELYAALNAHQAKLPWSRDAHAGWLAEPERWYRPGRPETDGWEASAAETYDGLWKALRKAAAAVQGHDHWSRCKQHGVTGADLVATRQALKNADGAVPAGKEDVPALDQEDVERAA
ncbi:hypothetical protein SAMN06272735_9296 [Streptomyces sp. TLI_55]|uniref:hypothetical protein n=1 Tax=Streptomyces sp. TLI_55 TaxID=1938861 RepID=UPI000BC7DC0A|nr:hypothetical protein [Streptomyces sp. TLI_55]SNX88787.1 hypothetical protein SAMN06272735_9296 [Streptomyces sp. TLI_55]